MPTKKGYLLLWLISVIALAGEIISPTYELPSGRLAMFFAPIWHQFGWQGIAGFWAMCATVFFGLWMKKKNNDEH